jgi:hypothetical protein
MNFIFAQGGRRWEGSSGWGERGLDMQNEVEESGCVFNWIMMVGEDRVSMEDKSKNEKSHKRQSLCGEIM